MSFTSRTKRANTGAPLAQKLRDAPRLQSVTGEEASVPLAEARFTNAQAEFAGSLLVLRCFFFSESGLLSRFSNVIGNAEYSTIKNIHAGCKSLVDPTHRCVARFA
jgi:hypothetical protein